MKSILKRGNRYKVKKIKNKDYFSGIAEAARNKREVRAAGYPHENPPKTPFMIPPPDITKGGTRGKETKDI